jgi:hypothetical protein
MTIQMKAAEQTPSAGATPEQLLTMLDLQIASQRQRRTKSSRNRSLVLVGGLLFILGAAAVAFMVLGEMLSELQGSRAVEAPPAEEFGQR